MTLQLVTVAHITKPDIRLSNFRRLLLAAAGDRMRVRGGGGGGSAR